VRKLPEAEVDSGIVGNNFKESRQILIIGESSMAGVGSYKHETSFAGTLAEELSEKLKVKIHWKVYAKRGLTVNKITEQIIPSITEKKVDLIIVGVG
jgi:lysophospholipase L1-like esterase